MRGGSEPVYGAQEKILGPVSVTPHVYTARVGKLRQNLLSSFGGLLSPPTNQSLIVIYLTLQRHGSRSSRIRPTNNPGYAVSLLSRLGSEELESCNFRRSAWRGGTSG